MEIRLQSIGVVENKVLEKKDVPWGDKISCIVVDDEYKDGLKGLETFSHAMVLSYLHLAKFTPQKHMVRRPKNRVDMPEMGIFAQRTKDHPNPVGVSVVKILKLEGNKVWVQALDSMNGTPVLDIKPYYPVFDRRDEAVTPEWVDRLMADYYEI